MIKFFRKIRQQLLAQNKVSKYLLYAIGEIALVVIGILIALHINNRNEKIKLRKEEIATLENFQESFQNDLKRIQRTKKFHALTKKSFAIIINHLENNISYHDTLKYHFCNTTAIWAININESVFETLKSKDLNLISSTKLRESILYYYDIGNRDLKNSQSRYKDILEEGSINILNTRFDEFWNWNFETWKQENQLGNEEYSLEKLKCEMIPIDYEKLKDDQEYIYFLKSLKNRHDWYLELHNESMEKNVTVLLDMIKEELKK